MSEEEYLTKYYKRFIREPSYYKVLSNEGQVITTNTGIKIKAIPKGGVVIQYKKKNGNKLTSIVYKERQYIEEYYRISELAYHEHPEVSKPIIQKMVETAEEKAERIAKIEKELRLWQKKND